VACTVEMASLGMHADVAVIDEIQVSNTLHLNQYGSHRNMLQCSSRSHDRGQPS
jgi:hypothetical protein